MNADSPFRDDADTLRERRATLMEKLEAAQTAAHEADQLRARIKAVDALLSGSTEELIQQVRFETPCAEPWDEMRGDETSRHCDRCDKRVYDFTYMTRDQIAQLLMNHEAPCVRLRRRPDGRVVTADCPPEKKRNKRLMLQVVAAAATAATVWGAAYYYYDTQAGCRAVETETLDITAGLRSGS